MKPWNWKDNSEVHQYFYYNYEIIIINVRVNVTKTVTTPLEVRHRRRRRCCRRRMHCHRYIVMSLPLSLSPFDVLDHAANESLKSRISCSFQGRHSQENYLTQCIEKAPSAQYWFNKYIIWFWEIISLSASVLGNIPGKLKENYTEDQ